jgi:murein DD-endopeptidase MepM/ murein hydrolase activator NlpD/predicted nucleotidyltransferase
MKKDTEILSSFDLKKGLNPKVWVKDNKSTKLKPEIREKLLEIAYEFIEFLGIDIIVSDVHMTGSMANYNWSKYSDFDLHVIVDFEQFPKEQLDLYKELFKLKKTLFNSDHNIKIYGYDVELYLQDSNEPHFSTGVYSVIYNKWLTPPKKGDFKADKEILMSKVNQWTEKIDEVIDSAKGKDLEAALKLLGGFKDKLKKYRQSGLEGGGELSYENLVFKYLRRNGYIEKLFNFEKEKVDKELSLEEKLIMKKTLQEELRRNHELLYGNKLNEQDLENFFKKLFTRKKDKESEVKIDDPKKADLVGGDANELYKTLESIKEPISQQQKGKMNFQKDVETVQIALQLLGYELPKYGVDGLFGPETGSAVVKFKTDNKLKESFKNLKKNLNESLPQLDSFPVGGGQYNIGWDKQWDNFSSPSNTANSDFSKKATNAGAGGHKKGHFGVDIFGPKGAPILSPVNGVVSYDNENGLTIIVSDPETGYSHWLGHLDKRIAQEGATVTAGEQVGTLGQTGNAAGTAPHLHYNVYKTSSGYYSSEDPIEILKGSIGKSTSAPINKSEDGGENKSVKGINESLPSIDTFPIAGGQYNIGWDKNWDDFNNPAGTANTDFTRKATNAGAGGHKHGHIGVDIFGKKGTPIVAPVDGKVKYGSNGLTVIVQDDKTGFSHWLGHLDSITVKQGEFVSAGQQVGTLGNSGNASGTAPHLHYNVFKTSSGFNSGEDPIGILKDAISKSTNTPIKKSEGSGENEYEPEQSGSISITPEMIKVMIEKLKSKGIESKDLTKYLDVVNTGGGEGFTDIDLISNEGYEKYESICQKFISSRKSNLLGITGKMMVNAAKNTYSKYQKYVPPQLALAQMTVEGGFSSDPTAKPIRTKNPYNIMNYDDGRVHFFPDTESAIQAYYDLIARDYLTGGKTAKDLVNNFVNKNNNRYASSSKYESSLNNLVNQINNTV